MNWTRVLNVFIIIFLVLNITICSFDWYTSNTRYKITSERKDLLNDVFNEKGLPIKCYIPKYYPKASLLVNSQNNRVTDIANNILGDDYTIVDGEIKTKYSTSFQSLSYNKIGENVGVLEYKGYSEKYKPINLENKEIEKVVFEFVRDITLSDNKFEIVARQYSLDEKTKKESYTLRLNEIYKDEVLFCSYVWINIDENGIKEANSIRFNPMKFEGDLREIYPVDEALYAFVEDYSIPKDTFITYIDLGYELNEDTMINSDMIEAIPYYRITLSNGHVEVINAYTLK